MLLLYKLIGWMIECHSTIAVKDKVKKQMWEA
jgi:hypothetical protein